ncbi:MAG: CDP-alcohol phosphatidyltransferase family protein [Candidatus Diapherotrites archaeon]|uniref:CDP-alcohol phosphatidyltransferase family protein n=1 Tax=Candidatus Iainarchaeum sp. TaxID=3101447 RepID=A0A8T4L3V0_9ARCH|nr:CDP-alcohol phosphatidyltransferase family protein [Candidatus Diapherotrites archaeon]
MTLYAQREKFKQVSIKIGLLFSKIPLTANQWTVLSLVPVIFAVWFLMRQDFLAAGVLFLISAFLDMVDGAVARVTNTASKYGAYLDTIMDRYIEGLIIFGLVFAVLPNWYLPVTAWIFAYFFGSFLTTYAKSAAKEKEIIREGKELKGGLLERAERLFILFIGIVLAAFNPLWLVYVLALLAVLTNFSALQRIFIARRIAKQK